jgi:hypothetical protein
MLKLADVYTRTSRNGNVYLTAYLGGLKLLIFPVHKPEADGPSHTAFLAPRPPSQDRPARDAERGVATGEAINERADTWSRDQLSSSPPSGAGAGVLAGAGRAADPLTIEPIPDGGDDLPF